MRSKKNSKFEFVEDPYPIQAKLQTVWQVEQLSRQLTNTDTNTRPLKKSRLTSNQNLTIDNGVKDKSLTVGFKEAEAFLFTTEKIRFDPIHAIKLDYNDDGRPAYFDPLILNGKAFTGTHYYELESNKQVPAYFVEQEGNIIQVWRNNKIEQLINKMMLNKLQEQGTIAIHDFETKTLTSSAVKSFIQVKPLKIPLSKKEQPKLRFSPSIIENLSVPTSKPLIVNEPTTNTKSVNKLNHLSTPKAELSFIPTATLSPSESLSAVKPGQTEIKKNTKVLADNFLLTEGGYSFFTPAVDEENQLMNFDDWHGISKFWVD